LKTSEFPYYNPPFPEYNIVQARVIPHLDKDENIVVSFATATGKTVLAECCFAYHLQADQNCKVVYVCPYRSLGAEKYGLWKAEPQLSKYGVLLSTGDTDVNISEYDVARLIITTSESFDSKTRSGLHKDWLQDVVCVVFDEAHLLGDKHRGSAVEMSMIRMAKVNPNARLILLSATMGNTDDVAKWVKSLNGKKTICAESSWRPVRVETEYHAISDTDEKIEKAIELVKESTGMKTVVFVHSKIIGSSLTKRLRSLGMRAVFHNASVPATKRRKMEDRFNDRMSGLNVLVSTSTLSAGVNIGL
jgi:replicative superfamily II helicase